MIIVQEDEREETEKYEVMKDMHFQLSEELFNKFLKAYPERGERKIILTAFVKEAIAMQSLKDYFTTLVGKQVMMKKLNREDFE